MFVIDPSAQNRLHQTGRSDQMEYADAGIYTVPGQNAVRAGINRVKTYLQTDALTDLRELRRAADRVPSLPLGHPEDTRRRRPGGEADQEGRPPAGRVALRHHGSPSAAGRTRRGVVDQPLYKRLVEDALRQDTRPQGHGLHEGGPGRFL
jgi:hypothetical protein